MRAANPGDPPFQLRTPRAVLERLAEDWTDTPRTRPLHANPDDWTETDQPVEKIGIADLIRWEAFDS